MSVKRFAFPVLDALHLSTTHMVEISREIIPRANALLMSCLPPQSAAADGRLSAATLLAEDGSLQCTLWVGDTVALPLTVVGTAQEEGAAALTSSSHNADGDCDVLVHCAGLPGAFPVRLSELANFRGRVGTPLLVQRRQQDDGEEASVRLGSRCLLESIGKYGIGPLTLDRYYRRGRRGHLACAGSAELLARGEEINEKGLQLDFPYHCGGVQATKRFLDITDAACTHFAPHGKHGTKILSRYGVLTSVGVAAGDGVRLPSLFWHPSGAPAACSAPVVHGCRTLPVGAVALAYNGPTNRCEVTAYEDPRRYMNPTGDAGYDCTTWLTEGLFGVRPGDAWARGRGDAPLVVLGVGYDEREREFELFLQNTRTGAVTPANDV